MKKFFNKIKKESGQSVVEFAVVLPILLLIVCAIIDFGWLFYNNISVNNCSREGARFAIVKDGTTASNQLIVDRIISTAPDGIKDSIEIDIAYSNNLSPKKGDVTVTISADIPVLTPILGLFVDDQIITVTSKTTMKME